MYNVNQTCNNTTLDWSSSLGGQLDHFANIVGRNRAITPIIVNINWLVHHSIGKGVAPRIRPTAGNNSEQINQYN
jgi:hypothetical protein